MFNGRRQPSCGGTSRMTRECHVRFCERLGVQFSGPTRQSRSFKSRVCMTALLPKAEVLFRSCDVAKVPQANID
jgi:hypothetical protein